MKLLQKGIGILVLLLVVATASGQVGKLRINEVMINNQNNYIDRFGHRSSWIEIYNTYGATVNIGGCYLTNDPANPTKYRIPKGDLNTKIGPRQFVLFWTDNNPTFGTFHLNFELDQTRDNYIALYDNSGKVLIDEMIIPAAAASLVDKSYGRVKDGEAECSVLLNTTPNFINMPQDDNTASQNFKKQDPIGIGMSFTAMSVVFTALVLLYLAFKTIANIYISMTTKKVQREAESSGVPTAVAEQRTSEISGEVCAAIALALYQYENDLHDHEDTVLTIEETQRRYSPWSSKIYTLRQVPQVKPSNRNAK